MDITDENEASDTNNGDIHDEKRKLCYSCNVHHRRTVLCTGDVHGNDFRMECIQTGRCNGHHHMMKSAIYYGKEDVRIEERDNPVCGDNDIIIKNRYASICGTDVAVYTHGPNTGHKITVGEEFGHEVVSEVAEVGKNVKDIAVGDIVYPYPLLATGDPRRAGTISGFSQYIRIPDCEIGKQIYKVSDKIPLKTAALIEPFTVGTRAARRSDPKPGEKAIVFGAGTIGIAAAMALKQIFGCAQVMLADVSAFRLEKAKKLDFPACNPAKQDVQKEMTKVFGEAHGLGRMTADADIFIDAAGAESVLDTFMKIGKIGSRFVAVAVSNALKQLDILHLTYAQKSIIGSGGYMPEDVRDVMSLMESGAYDIASIITHEFPLDEISRAIATAADTEHALNVIINHEKSL